MLQVSSHMVHVGFNDRLCCAVTISKKNIESLEGGNNPLKILRKFSAPHEMKAV